MLDQLLFCKRMSNEAGSYIVFFFLSFFLFLSFSLMVKASLFFLAQCVLDVLSHGLFYIVVPFPHTDKLKKRHLTKAVSVTALTK